MMTPQHSPSASYEGAMYFGAFFSANIIWKLIRRDFCWQSSADRVYDHGLPFPHQLMAHRGGSMEHIENSLTAFRHSAKLGADILELDVQLTRDDQVVICHDDSLRRVCGVDVRIQDLAYDELPPLVIPDAMISDGVSPDSTRIPLLLELLDEFPQYPMQIDVKSGGEKLVRMVGNYIKEYRREKFTVWGSFVPRANQTCYDLFGTEIPLFFCARRAWLSYILYKLGLFSLLPLRETALIIPNLQVFLFSGSKGFFKAMNSRGVSVLMFGTENGALNTEMEWNIARNIGANGICTDVPTLLKNWLETSPLQVVRTEK